MWRDRAACRGMDVNIFFPEVGQNADKAKRICATCPVRQDCLDEAVANNERIGIWGGQYNAQILRERKDRGVQRVRRDVSSRTADIMALRDQGLSGYAIGKRLGLPANSVRWIIQREESKVAVCG